MLAHAQNLHTILTRDFVVTLTNYNILRLLKGLVLADF